VKPRAARGAVNHRAGLAAEDAAVAHYAARGGLVLARRWRGPTMEGRRCPEIDLVVALDGVLVFVEVKRGADATALARIGPRGWARLEEAARCYIVTHQKGEVAMRFDAVLVTPDGRVAATENAHDAEAW